MEAVLLTLVLAIRDLALAIQPVIPTRAGAVLDMLGIPDGERNYADLDHAGWYDALVAAGHVIAKPEPMFPRLELASEAA